MWEIDLTHFWCLLIALMKLHNEIETNLYRHHKVSYWVLLILRIGFWMCHVIVLLFLGYNWPENETWYFDQNIQHLGKKTLSNEFCYPC